jgi:hypothetical protein
MQDINLRKTLTINNSNELFDVPKTVGYCLGQITSVLAILRDIQLRWEDIDPIAKTGKKVINWKEYRFYDTIEVCTQEAERIANCLRGVPGAELLGSKPLMQLEQDHGLWQPYVSDEDDSDDENWQETSPPWHYCNHETDEDEIQEDCESDIEIVE